MAENERHSALLKEVAEMQEREAQKNKEIDELRARLSTMQFNEAMKPVEERLTQTPYSRRAMGDASQSQRTEHDEPNVVSQYVTPPPVSAPTSSGTPGTFLSNMQHLAAEMQREIIQQQSLPQDAPQLELQQQLEEVKGSVTLLAEQKGTEKARHQREVQALRQELTALKKGKGAETIEKENVDAGRLKEAQKALKEANGEVQTLRQELTALKGKGEKDNVDAGRLKEAQKALKEANGEAQSLKAALAEKTAEIVALNAKTTATQHQVRATLEGVAKAADDAMAQAAQEKASTTSRLAAALKQQEKMEESLTKLQNTAAQGSTAMATLTEQLAVASKEADASQKTIAELEQKCAYLTTSNKKSLKHQKDALNKDIATLKKEVADFEKERATLAASTKKAAAAAEENASTAAATNKKLSNEVAKLIEERAGLEKTCKELRKALDAHISATPTAPVKTSSPVRVKAGSPLPTKLTPPPSPKPTAPQTSETRKTTRAALEEPADATTAPKRRKLNPASESAPSTPTANVPVVTLSGFRDTHEKREIFKNVSSLGGQVMKAGVDQFDNSCTHMIIPSPEARTVKTVAAVLTGKWVMTSLWVKESAEAGHFIDETQYGYRLEHEGIKSRNVYLTKAFQAASPERYKQALQLITYGGGNVVQQADTAAVVLRAAGEKKTRGGSAFNNTWESFIAWVFPTEWRPPAGLAEGK